MSFTEDDSWEVSQWLKSFGLQQYTGQFLDNGYETKKLCSNLKNEDLNEMNIKNPLHRDIIFNNSESLRKGETSPMVPVLQSCTLAPPGGEQYSTVFDDTDSNNFNPATRWKHGQSSKSPQPRKKISSPERPEGIRPQRLVRRSPSSPARTVIPVVSVRNKEPMKKLTLKRMIKEQIIREGICVTAAPYVNQVRPEAISCL